MVVLRTQNEEEAALLAEEDLGEVFLNEHELARGVASHILAKIRGTPAVSSMTKSY